VLQACEEGCHPSNPSLPFLFAVSNSPRRYLANPAVYFDLGTPEMSFSKPRDEPPLSLHSDPLPGTQIGSAAPCWTRRSPLDRVVTSPWLEKVLGEPLEPSIYRLGFPPVGSVVGRTMMADRRSSLDRTADIASYPFGRPDPLTPLVCLPCSLNCRPARALASWVGPALCCVGRSDLAHDSCFLENISINFVRSVNFQNS
jgi:hypothetical protein